MSECLFYSLHLVLGHSLDNCWMLYSVPSYVLGNGNTAMKKANAPFLMKLIFQWGKTIYEYTIEYDKHPSQW